MEWKTSSTKFREATPRVCQERLGTQPEAEADPIVPHQGPLLVQCYQADDQCQVCQPQRGREARTGRAGVVGGLVRRLMATERARILGRKTIDLGRYALEKRAQRWKESKEGFK